MNFKANIPNILTAGNLICGSIAALYIAIGYDATPAVFLIFIAAFLDLLDGAVARMLKVNGDLGKQLDSLADVISFGLVPSIIIFKMLEMTLPTSLQPLKFIAFLNVTAAAIRLARFNIATNNSGAFSGMPSPANGIFWASLLAIKVWILRYGDETYYALGLLPYSTIIVLTIATSLLMVSGIRMFSFKMKGGFGQNRIQWIYLLMLAIMLVWALIFVGNILIMIPAAILLYIFMSLVNHVLAR